MEAILVSVLTSLIASLIFWYLFDYLPNKIKYNKIRAKVEFDIYEIYVALFFYIQAPLQTNINKYFYPQDRLRSGLVSRKEFNFWLQNKCLNDTYMFDEMRDKLIPIGSKLEKSSKGICTLIEKCSTYYSFMTGDEILLLRKISAKLTVHSYTNVVGKSTSRPLIPNLSYMADNFYETSQLFVELQEIVWKFKKLDKSINKYAVVDFSLGKSKKAYLQGNYKKCIWLAKCKSNSHTIETHALLFRSYYDIGKRKKALLYLDKYLDNFKLKPVYIRNLFADIYKKEYYLSADIIEVLSRHYSEIEIIEMNNQITRDQRILDDAVKVNQEILEFYNQKKGKNISFTHKEIQ